MSAGHIKGHSFGTCSLRNSTNLTMHPETILLIERLVVAVESISDNVSRIRISLKDMNTNVSYLVTEKRRSYIPDVPLLLNAVKETTIATTDVPPATCLDEHPAYIKCADSGLFGNEYANVDIGKDTVSEDDKYLPSESATSIDTHVLTSSCSNNDEGKHDATSLEKSFQAVIKVELSDLESDSSLSLERSRGYTRAMMEAEESFQTVIKEELSDIESDSSLTYVRSCGNTGLMMEDEENKLADSFHVDVEEENKISEQIKQENLPTDCSDNDPLCVEEANEIKEQVKEENLPADCSSNDPLCNEEVNDFLEQIKQETGDDCVSPAAETVSMYMETRSEGECRGNREVQRREEERDPSDRKDEKRSSLLKARSRCNKGQIKYEKSFCCETCGKCFRWIMDLERHNRFHTGEKPFICSLCSKAFSQKCNLVTHYRVHAADRPFRCSVCGKTFKLNNILQVHLQLHTGDKPFTCTVCERGFSLKNTLIKHMRTHTGDTPFKCNLCEKAFAQSSQLTYHMLSHTGERPFQCSVCKMTFKLRSHLNDHLRRHTGNKPYTCTVCEEAFAQKNTLYAHMRQHTGEKSFECSVCEKTFGRRVSLNVHMRTHTGEKPFKCSLCEKAFVRRTYLKKHLRTHERQKPC